MMIKAQMMEAEWLHGICAFDLLKYVDDGDGMLSFVEQHRAEYSELDEAAMRLIYALVDIDFYVDEQEGKVSDMCKALDDIIKIGEAK